MFYHWSSEDRPRSHETRMETLPSGCRGLRGSLVVQWLRLHASPVGSRALSLIRELRCHMSRGAAEKKKQKKIEEDFPGQCEAALEDSESACLPPRSIQETGGSGLPPVAHDPSQTQHGPHQPAGVLGAALNHTAFPRRERRRGPGHRSLGPGCSRTSPCTIKPPWVPGDARWKRLAAQRLWE